jgi:hypothetical protein
MYFVAVAFDDESSTLSASFASVDEATVFMSKEYPEMEFVVFPVV